MAASTPARENLEFQADTARLLHLMVHSLYTQKEIFLRELISNASDALDRLHFERLAHPEWLTGEPLEIRLEVDKTARTLTVSDNGIGMRREEISQYLGTIARSMAHATVNRPPQEGAAPPPELIGQFGVGFYSSFMVADRVVVVTRHPSEAEGARWECQADSSSYTIESAGERPRGTSVTLHLRKADPDAGLEDYADSWVIRRLVKRHSDFIAYPILLRERSVIAPVPIVGEGAAGDADAGAGEAADPASDPNKPLNSMKPIWTRPAAEVSEQEFHEFYKHVSHDWHDPQLRFAFKAEGRSEYQALLFVPAEAPHDLFYHAAPIGLQLYARRVLVMERCEDLLPRYLRFIKGIVDSADLPLHISRQMLQENQHLAQIRKWLTRKVLDSLAELQVKDAAKYLAFWKPFGRVLKEGIGIDHEHHDRLVARLLFESSHDPEALTSLTEYVARMKPDQTEIYYLTGETRAIIEHAPQLEAFREKHYEVLYLSDPVDELVVQSLPNFDGKRLRSVSKGTPALGDEEERKKRDAELEDTAKQFTALFGALQRTLDADVREVRLSPRLVDAPACLTGEEFDFSPRLEQLLMKGKGGGPRRRRILELNSRHPIVQQLQTQCTQDAESPIVGQFARLLYGYALLAEGSELTDPVAFTRALTEVMKDRLSPAAP